MDFQSVARACVLSCLCTLFAAAPGAQEPAVDSEPAYSPRGADTCLGCHGFDQGVLAIFRGKHAVPTDARSPFGDGQLQCEACHGPGGAHAGRVRRGQERPPMIRAGYGQNERCLECHTANMDFGWHGSNHDADEVACAACHTVHAARDPVLETSAQAEVCFGCHLSQRGESLRAFAHPLFRGKMGCTGCHSPHAAAAEPLLAGAALNDTCYQCHAEKRGPYIWEHAPVAEDCTLCHAPHGSNHPGMLTQRAPLLCQGCHSQSGHPSIAHDAGGIATAAPSQFLLGQSCLNCHEQVHGSNHPSGSRLLR
jgi:DmsE family decaheme c-type cytochrome